MAARGVCAEEIEKFRRLQSFWWDPSGPLRSLHLFNATRVGYIQEACSKQGRLLHAVAVKGAPGVPSAPFRRMTVLDVGCGGGLLSESLARLGANVTGIDACTESIGVANQRLSQVESRRRSGTSPLQLSFQNVSLFEVQEQFDLVVATEVMEHVDDPAAFLKACCERTADGGLLVISTMEKTLCTLLSHIAVAEHLTALVPPGTHDWAKFLPSADITTHARRHAVRNVDVAYILATPAVARCIATGNLELDFNFTRRFNSGHYFWSGVKIPMVAAAAPAT